MPKPIILNGYQFSSEYVEKHNMRFYCTLDGISIWVQDNPSYIPNSDETRKNHRFCRWNGLVRRGIWEAQLDKNKVKFDHMIMRPDCAEAIKDWAGGRAVFNTPDGRPSPKCPYCQDTGKVMLLITAIKCPDCHPKE